MPLTKIQPSGLDQTQNYSVNQVTANTVVAGGVDVLSQANTALSQANAAFSQANTAITTVNTSYVSQFLFMGA